MSNNYNSKIINPDPHNWGPGMWMSMTITSLSVKNKEDLSTFKNFVFNLISFIPCKECRYHAMEYLEKNSVHEFDSMIDENGNYMGAFMWVYKFHNSVNERLKKKSPSISEVLNFYKSMKSSPCSIKDCSSAKNNKVEKQNINLNSENIFKFSRKTVR